MSFDPLPKNSTLVFEKVDAPSANMVSKHIHNLFELYYLESGCCDYFVDNRIYRVEAGDVLIIPSGILHRTVYSSPHRARTVVYFSPALVPLSILQTVLSGVHQIRCERLNPDIRFFLSKMEENYRSDRQNAREVMTLLLQTLLLMLFQGNPAENRERLQQSVCGEIVRYVQTHYMEHISLQSIATEFSVSKACAGKLLKKECGMGFCEYLMLVRLQNAWKMLLSDSKKSITDVAYACGFSDSNYFSVCFKRAFGVVPRSVREKAKT